MGLWSWIRGGDSAIEQRNEEPIYLSALDAFGPIGLNGADPGVPVTPQTALTASAVYAAVSIIASAIGTLPVHVQDRKTGDKLIDHPLRRLFDQPNDDMAWPDLIEALCLNLLTTGNGYIYVERDRYFQPAALYPLKSLNTYPERQNGKLRYVTGLNGAASPLPPESVIHARNMAWEGILGISPLRCGAGAVGLALALDRFAATFFKNGANVQGILKLPPMNKEALAEFKRRWKEEYQGLGNSHKVAPITEGQFYSTSISPRDSQAVESRKFQLQEVARIYQIPPHKLADLERATFSNIEEQSRDFAENTLRRWVVKIEHALERVLVREAERGKIKVRLNLGAIIRGSLKDQIEALTKATGGAPIYTQNEARDYLGMRRIKGGDALLSNLNQKPADQRAGNLMRSIAGNLANKEANAIKRAAKKHAEDREAFEAWAEQFYAEHAQVLCRALEGADLPEQFLADHCRAQAEKTVQAFQSGQIDARIRSIEEESGELLVRDGFEKTLDEGFKDAA